MYLREELLAGDLEHMIEKIVYVDKYNSKMGDDEDIVVIAFQIVDQNACQDIENFLERGYSEVLDADSAITTNERDGYLCFVEVARDKKFKETFDDIMEGISRLSKIPKERFLFKYHKSMRSLTLDKLYDIIPMTSDDYKKYMKSEEQKRKIKEKLSTLENKLNSRKK